jgi:FkbM family methyltransferase
MREISKRKVKVRGPHFQGLITRVKTKLKLIKLQEADLYYRPDSAGDNGVIVQIFWNADYDLGQFAMTSCLMRYRESIQDAGRQPLIIDAGANIGVSAVYFSMTYAESRIVAIEPERENLKLLAMNCAGRNIDIRAGAVSSADGSLFLSSPAEGSDWSFRAGSQGEYEVEAITIDGLLADHGADKFTPFICKIDIEGGEADLFSKNYQWIDSFPLVIIELHDEMLPGQGNARNFLKALTEFDFDFMFRGENAFCYNNRILRAYTTR